jgi:hypothetical protein
MMYGNLAVTPATVGIAALLAVAAWLARDKLLEAVRANSTVLAKYGVITGVMFLVGRRLGSAWGSSPGAWLSTALDALTGVIPVV